jgi:hypothetical protein
MIRLMLHSNFQCSTVALTQNEYINVFGLVYMLLTVSRTFLTSMPYIMFPSASEFSQTRPSALRFLYKMV